METERTLRQPGFVFVELYVEDPAYYVRIFRDAFGRRFSRRVFVFP